MPRQLLRPIGVVAIAGFAAACASMIDGNSQSIFVSTNPAGANCGFYREGGYQIAMIQSTPGQAFVQKSKADIWIVCVKPGYQEGIFYNHSGVAGSAFVNVIGGIFTLGISTAIGVAVDSSNGSDNKYDSPINFSMVPNDPNGAAGPTTLPQRFDSPKLATTGSQQMISLPATAAPAEPATTPTSTTTAPVAATTTAPAASTPATAPVATDSTAPSAAPQTNDWHNRFRL
jgi:hypothetical protein